MQARLLDLPLFAKMSTGYCLGEPSPFLAQEGLYHLDRASHPRVLPFRRCTPLSPIRAGQAISARRARRPRRPLLPVRAVTLAVRQSPQPLPRARANPRPPTTILPAKCAALPTTLLKCYCVTSVITDTIFIASPPGPLPRVPVGLWYCPQCTPNAAALQGPSPASKQSPPDHAPAHPPKRTRSQTAGISGPLPHDRQVALGAPGTVGPNHRPTVGR